MVSKALIYVFPWVVFVSSAPSLTVLLLLLCLCIPYMFCKISLPFEFYHTFCENPFLALLRVAFTAMINHCVSCFFFVICSTHIISYANMSLNGFSEKNVFKQE